MKFMTIWMKIKTFFTKKKIIWMIVIFFLLFGIWLIFARKSNTSGIQTIIVKQQDIKKTALTTGQVISSTDLDLSFPSSGIVKKVLVKEGAIVHTGQVLAEEDTSDLVAQLHSAEAGLTITEQETAASKDNLDNVIAEQNTLVTNAYSNLLNSTPEAVPYDGTSDYVAPIISGNYNLNKEGTIKIIFYYSAGGVSFSISGLTQGSGSCNTINSQPLGDSGLYIKCSTTTINIADWNIEIPNKKASNYLTNYNAYQLALQTKESAISSAQANVGVTNSSSALIDAKVAQAKANVESITVKIENAKIVAPNNGTITQVDIKVGELAQGTKEVIKLLNIGNLHTEALVSEADIASVAVGQSIDNTFDALGPDKHFTTTVLTVNPASTVISGVVNYKVTGSLKEIPEIKPGMTVNMTIEIAEKKNVLAIPGNAIIDKNNKHIVRVINNTKNKTYTEVEVETGLEADGGLTEIISGLNEGEEIVTYIK